MYRWGLGTAGGLARLASLHRVVKRRICNFSASATSLPERWKRARNVFLISVIAARQDGSAKNFF